MIYTSTFKNAECIVLENDCLKVIVLPKIGAKIASIYYKKKDFELLFQNKFAEYKKPNLYSAFEEFDASGFDDAFPTIDECTVTYENKKILYPDHGEIWTSSFDYEIQNEKAMLNFESNLLPYKYKKIIHLINSTLKIQYEISNTSNTPIPCIWAMHCLINCEKDMQINFPNDTDKIINVHESKNLGHINTIHNFPITKTHVNKNYLLNKIGDKKLNNTEKYYAYGNITEGICSAYYPNENVKYIVKFDEKILPYLGFWVTEGGFRGDYNCALEPTNSFYDNIDIALKNNKLYYLKKDKDLKFNIDLSLL